MGYFFKAISIIYFISAIIIALIDSKFNYGFDFYAGYYWISNIGIALLLFGIGHLILQLNRIKK